MSNNLDLNEKTKTILESWEVANLSLEDQTKWLNDYLIRRIINIVANNDTVEEIIVHEKIYEAVVEALYSATIPEDIPVNESISRDDANKSFQETCRKIVVRSASTDFLTLPEGMEAPPEEQFIRVISKGAKQQGFIEQWDRDLGFSATLSQFFGTAVPLPSLNEKRMLFYIFHMLNLMGQLAQQQNVNTKVDDQKRASATQTPPFNLG